MLGLIWIFCAFVVGYVVPGYLAYHADVVSPKQLEAKVIGSIACKEICKTWQALASEPLGVAWREDLKRCGVDVSPRPPGAFQERARAVRSATAALRTLGVPSHGLARLCLRVIAEHTGPKGQLLDRGVPALDGEPSIKRGEAIHLLSFFPGESSLVWPLSLSAIGLLFLWFARHDRSIRFVEYACWGGVIALANVGANWMREEELLASFEAGRRVFTHSQRDLNLPGFYSLLGNFALLSAWLGAIWTHWLAEARACTLPDLMPLRTRHLRLARRVSTTFVVWEKASLLLAFCFLPGTIVYWRLVFLFHDRRYIVPALVLHALWLITWCILSRPLLTLWSAYQLSSLSEASRGSTVKLEPIAPLSAAVALLTGLAAILSPFYEAFFKG